MLPGVYMVKFDMLNPNLTSKTTKNLNQSQKNRKTDVQTIQKIQKLTYNAIFDTLDRR